MLVEVLVGTVLLALATTAVLDGIDGAQDAGLRNKNRSVAATLAQQDLERLRSMPPTLLSNYDETRTVTVAGVDYTVVSRTDWVVDATGLVSCTSDDAEAEYMKLRSTVHAPASVAAPVEATSLLSPPPGAFADDTGTAAVKLTDRAGQPLAGVAVDLEGPGSLSATTNEVGCAIFGFVDAATWTAEVDGDWVSWSGLTPAQSAVTVAEGKTSLTQLELDDPASLRAHFETPSGAPAAWDTVGVVNAKLPGGARYFVDDVDEASKDVEGLFPFHDGYGVYASSCQALAAETLCCQANDPTVWDGDYFETSGDGKADLSPGELLEPVNVLLPTLHVTVTRQGGGPFSPARLTVTQLDGAYDSEPTSNECSLEVVDTSQADATATSYTFHVSVPFGHYRLCADYDPPSGTTRHRRTSASSTSADPDLTAGALEQTPANLVIPTSGSSGSC